MSTTLNLEAAERRETAEKEEVLPCAMGLRASAFDFHQHTSQEVVVHHLPCRFNCCEGGVDAVDSWKKKRIEGWRLARVATTLQIL